MDWTTDWGVGYSTHTGRSDDAAIPESSLWAKRSLFRKINYAHIDRGTPNCPEASSDVREPKIRGTTAMHGGFYLRLACHLPLGRESQTSG